MPVGKLLILYTPTDRKGTRKEAHTQADAIQQGAINAWIYSHVVPVEDIYENANTTIRWPRDLSWIFNPHRVVEATCSQNQWAYYEPGGSDNGAVSSEESHAKLNEYSGARISGEAHGRAVPSLFSPPNTTILPSIAVNAILLL